MTTKNSTLVENFEAIPQVANKVYQHYGRVRQSQGTIALATTDIDASDVIMLVPIPVHASVLSIKLASDDLDSNGTPTLAFNVGLHDVEGTAKDADCYATAITLGQAATAFTEYRFEAANITTTGQRVWEDAGDTEAPSAGHYYLSMTVSTGAATAAAGDIAFIVEWTLD